MANKLKHIHFVGIKGVGLTPLALIAKEAGIKVTGSDVADEFITDQALHQKGITPLVGFSEEHLPQELDLVITTGAHGGYDNVEVVEARRRGIPVLTKGEAVGEFMKGEILGRDFQGIAIAGSHGKTTTTAIVTTLFLENGLDPSYIIGTGSVAGKLPGHFGKGKYFIAESDEYATEPRHNHKAQFLWQHPDILLITNIEHDHPDIYPSVAEVVSVFEEFVTQVRPGGVIIGNGDDSHVYSLLSTLKAKTITFGFSPKNNFILTRVHISGSETFFRVTADGTDLGEFHIGVTGEHNALNALGAIVVALEAGLSLEKIKAALPHFTGSKRRLEYRGRLTTGAHIFDDYAHHPTEIKQTLRSLKMRYPKSTLIAVFQPHTFSRTKALLNEFVTAFDDAHNVILTDIFASAREAKDESMTSLLFSQKMVSSHPAVLYIPEPKAAAELLIKEKLKENTVVVFMGAGDIYKAIDLLPLE